MEQRIGNRIRTKELLCAYMFYAIIRHEVILRDEDMLRS